MESTSRFDLDTEVSFLNHGSYGAVPRVVGDVRLKFQLEMETNPDMWFRTTVKERWLRQLELLDEFIHSPFRNSLAFVRNVTEAVSSVLSGQYAWKYIVHLSIAYGAVKLAIMAERDRRNALECKVVPEVISINLNDILLGNCDSSSVLERISGTLERLSGELSTDNHGLFIMDHISSVPAVLFDVQKITRVARKFGFQILIDGAHCIGHIALDLKAIE
jgi:isopenicillin-N epimerase